MNDRLYRKNIWLFPFTCRDRLNQLSARVITVPDFAEIALALMYTCRESSANSLPHELNWNGLLFVKIYYSTLYLYTVDCNIYFTGNISLLLSFAIEILD